MRKIQIIKKAKIETKSNDIVQILEQELINFINKIPKEELGYYEDTAQRKLALANVIKNSFCNEVRREASLTTVRDSGVIYLKNVLNQHIDNLTSEDLEANGIDMASKKKSFRSLVIANFEKIKIPQDAFMTKEEGNVAKETPIQEIPVTEPAKEETAVEDEKSIKAKMSPMELIDYNINALKVLHKQKFNTIDDALNKANAIARETLGKISQLTEDKIKQDKTKELMAEARRLATWIKLIKANMPTATVQK